MRKVKIRRKALKFSKGASRAAQSLGRFAFDSFREEDHPRGPDGKFIDGAGGGAWSKKNQSERERVRGLPSNQQGIYLSRTGLYTMKQAVEVWKRGDAEKELDRYFEIMEENGDPDIVGESTTENNRGDGYGDEWKKENIKKDTGASEEQAKKYLDAINGYTGHGALNEENAKVLDEFIEKSPKYDGDIYRGMGATDDVYKKFSGMKAGEVLDFGDRANSWTSSKKDQALHENPDAKHSVIFKCIKNRSGIPIEKYTSFSGEHEVLAPSTSKWTVLRVDKDDSGDQKRAVVTVVERGEGR